jgi:predicted MFS family arabinose efflux permease
VRPLLILACAIVFVDTSFYAAMTPMLPHLEDELGLSKSAAGLLAGAYPAGTLLGALPGGYVAAKVGPRATVLLGLALMTVAGVAFALADHVVLLDAARFVQGIGGAATWAGALAWLAAAAPASRRGEMIGTAFGAAVAGALLGPVLGAAAEAVGRGPVFVAVAASGIGLAAWALRVPPAVAHGTSTPRELLGSLKHGRVAGGMALVMVPGLVFGTIGVLVPLRLDELGVGAAIIAATFLVAAGLESGVGPWVGRLSDRRGRLVPSLAALASASVLLVIFPWPVHAWQLIVLVILAEPLVGILWAPATALLSDGAEHLGIAQGFAFALSNLAWGVGQTIGAAGSARLADATSDTVPFLVLAGMAVVATTVVFRAIGASARTARLRTP